ncbi:MAG: hypothetical protein E7282_03190 [Lachnospiraceae bacterium]|nr:hypothetical protein [Lachnospiraceae bacterium]
MIKIGEMHIAFLAGCALLLAFFEADKSVFIFLLGIIFTELAIWLSELNEKNHWLWALGAIYLIGCLFLWQLLMFMPVVVYMIVEQKIYPALAILLFAFIALISVANKELLFVWCGAVIFSGLLAFEHMRAEENRKRYIQETDAAVVLENSLKKKNKELMENQDVSVHVAMLQERNRIAREIHDNVGHMLSRTILQTGALMTIYKENPLHEQLESINGSLNEAMNNIRESVHDLHNDSLELERAVEDAATQLKNHFQVRIEYDMTDSVPRNIKYCFLAIAKEAFENARKYCDGTKVSVVMREHPGFYQMAIEDDGTQKLNREKAGIGLKNMEERVRGLDGSIHISDENGFHILLSIPKKTDKEFTNESSSM